MEAQSDFFGEVKVKARDEEVQKGEEAITVANGGEETIGSFMEGVHRPADGWSSPTPIATTGPNAAVPARDQLTIFYGGSVAVFDGIPAEKVREIMLIAASATAAVKPAEMKEAVSGSPAGNTPVLMRSPSFQSATSPLPSPQAYPGSPSCKLQAELPIARKHSLQRFFEKRRDRLGNKSPCPVPPAAIKVETAAPDSNAEHTSDAGCFGKSLAQEKEMQQKVAANPA